MKALILRQNAESAGATSRALMDKGFQILCVETQTVAHALIRVDTIDLLVMDERIGGQLTHAIALSGERKNPYLSAILLTDRSQAETDDLYQLIPSLYALAGTQVGADVLGKLALAAVANVEEAAARVARQAAEMTEIDMEVADEVSGPALASDLAEPVGVQFLTRATLPPLVLDQPLQALESEPDEVEKDITPTAPVVAPVAHRSAGFTLDHLDDEILSEVAAMFRRDGINITPKGGLRAPVQSEPVEFIGGAI